MANLQDYTILSLVSLLSITIIVVRAVFGKTRPKPRLPPGPPALPVIGHLHLAGPIPHQAFHKISSKYGLLVHLSLGNVTCLVVSSLDMAREFLKTNEASFLDRPQFEAIEHLSYPSADFTFALHGPYWKFMRKLCTSRLLGGQTLDRLVPIRREELKRLLTSVMKKSRDRQVVGVEEELARMTNNVISRMTMSQNCSEDDSEAERIRKLVKETSQIAGRFNLSDYIWFCKGLDLQGIGKRCREIHDEFDAMMERIIGDREERRKAERNGKEGKDLLDILLDVSEDESSEFRLNKDHIKAFVMDLFVAGTDTTAKTIEWALAELINHPNIMEKAREEIYNVVGKTRLVEESDIPNLPYIQALTKETLRLHPTGTLIFRESNKSCTINGYQIPEKTRLFVNNWAICRDPKYWEDPLEFKPERFLEEQETEENRVDVTGQSFQLLPFGSGRRLCPGITLSMGVVQTSLAAMIQCFDWKSDGGDCSRVDMEEAPGMTLPRAHPLVCVPLPLLCPLPL